jgi:hypothetical protein
MGDNYNTTAFFPGYPYAAEQPGYLRIAPGRGGLGDEQEAHFGDPNYLREWAVRVSLEDGNDLRGLNRLNGRLALDTPLRASACNPTGTTSTSSSTAAGRTTCYWATRT